MARLTSLKYLLVASLGIAGIVVACHAATPEAPPLAPRPDPTAPAPSPVPSGPTVPDDPATPGPHFPTEDGGAPMPTPGPAPKEPQPISSSVHSIPMPDYRAERYQLVDAGVPDAFQIGDAMPSDAAFRDAVVRDAPPLAGDAR